MTQIRSIRAGDRAFFLRMVEAFYQSPAVCHRIPARNAERTFTQLMQGSPYASCLIAEENGTPCAYCLLALTWSNEAGGLCVWIDELMVDDDFRGQGIGSQLLAAVRERYPDAARFRLEVTKENEQAADLYRRRGFTPLNYRQLVSDTAL